MKRFFRVIELCTCCLCVCLTDGTGQVKKGAGAGNASDFGARVGGERSGYH